MFAEIPELCRFYILPGQKRPRRGGQRLAFPGLIGKHLRIVTEIILRAEALTAGVFAPFGDVIEIEGRSSRWINDGTCRRFDGLAQIDVTEAGGEPLLSIFEASPRALPLRVRALERHPLSSQAFFPLERRPFLVIVADPGPRPIAKGIHVFFSAGHQGVNFRRNTWHHSLVALDQGSRFLVVDRGGPDENCEEIAVDGVVMAAGPLPDPGAGAP
jgi:ureidoglycolate lyase